jgi:regulator of protease activity HflC (stomatin/prohibitin superfamily)
MKRIITTIVLVFVGLIVLTALSPLGTVGAGERGVRLRFGAVTGDILGEGLYFRVPIVESIRIVDVKVQKDQVEASAASADLQSVNSVVAVNFHVSPDKVATLFQEVGEDYKTRLVDPSLQESVKASTAKFTAEELITKREEVREEVKNHLNSKLQARGIIIDDFNIVDFNFSDSFNAAIEAKVTAEQSALAAKNKLEQIKFEADQDVASAHGRAEALKIESEALKSNPEILELRALEKWDGRLPTVTGGSVPFVNIPSLTR